MSTSYLQSHPPTLADDLYPAAAYYHDEHGVGHDHDNCDYDHSHATQYSSSDGVSNPAWDGPSYNQTAHHPPSASAQWAHPAQPEALWMTEHRADILDDDSPYYDSQMPFSDATGSISPMSDVSLESLPVVHEPVVLSSTSSSIANWNVLPHQNHHPNSTGGQTDSYSHAQYPLVAVSDDVPQQMYEVQQHQHQPALPDASSEHRRSRHENNDGLLPVSQSHRANRQYNQNASSESHAQDQQPYARDHQARSPVNEDREYSQAPVSPTYATYPASQYVALRQAPRPPSPMAHLPYPDEVGDEHTALPVRSQVEDRDSQWVEYQGQPPARRLAPLPDRTYNSHQPQMQYRPNNDPAYIPQAGPSRVARSTSRRLGEPPAVSHTTTRPVRSRSPPLIEDPPKKPLTLACLFCRKRKIACGSPPPDSPNRTCKYVVDQCARRSLKCVYPSASRRGMRPRNRDNEPPADGVFHMEVPVVVVTQ
ncbi:hypothetical protein EUX98_g7572 [Antrodiella citrinella]|uniref:Zn(2)-C6 fungal-type domain-containing protein n=1 Tax=Antrodiella citrinella TaxID=2447956 RepID=A0A4S4MNK2_9APHY|nr:hypothetical protein EUX98_g7572 [Antrodiella citrinella]